MRRIELIEPSATYPDFMADVKDGDFCAAVYAGIEVICIRSGPRIQMLNQDNAWELPGVGKRFCRILKSGTMIKITV